MAALHEYEVTALELTGSEYTVEQTGRDQNYRPEYAARNVAGDAIFRGTYRMYEEADEIPFVDEEGNEVFTVKACGTWDVAGDYVLTDSATEEDLVVFDNDLSLLEDTWRIRDADDRTLIAEITSRGALSTLARKILPFGQWVPHKYEITDAEDNAVGSIEGEFAIFDEYDVIISDPGSVPTAPIVIGAVVIDAIQGN